MKPLEGSIGHSDLKRFCEESQYTSLEKGKKNDLCCFVCSVKLQVLQVSLAITGEDPQFRNQV